MTVAIDLSPEDMRVLRAVLRETLPPEVKVWIFGSRATGGARRYSDLDLALEGETVLEPDCMALLRTALSESDLTVKVDVVDMRAIVPGFRRSIEAGMLPLTPDQH